MAIMWKELRYIIWQCRSEYDLNYYRIDVFVRSAVCKLVVYCAIVHPTENLLCTCNKKNWPSTFTLDKILSTVRPKPTLVNTSLYIVPSTGKTDVWWPSVISLFFLRDQPESFSQLLILNKIFTLSRNSTLVFDCISIFNHNLNLNISSMSRFKSHFYFWIAFSLSLSFQFLDFSVIFVFNSICICIFNHNFNLIFMLRFKSHLHFQYHFHLRFHFNCRFQ